MGVWRSRAPHPEWLLGAQSCALSANSTPQASAKKSLVTLRIRLGAEAAHHVLSRQHAHALPSIGVTEQLKECVRQFRNIPHRDQNPCYTVLQNLLVSSEGGRHDGETHRHCLDNPKAESLPGILRGRCEDINCRQVRSDLALMTNERHPAR